MPLEVVHTVELQADLKTRPSINATSLLHTLPCRLQAQCESKFMAVCVQL